jgi:endonuclease/exonuclease/phosphatase family metal-dependent hydrolase
MIETFRAIHPDAAEVCTYTDFDPSMLVGEKIDYIFCSEHFDVVDASIIRTTMEGRQPSDHFPLTALLQTKPSSEERGLR